MSAQYYFLVSDLEFHPCGYELLFVCFLGCGSCNYPDRQLSLDKDPEKLWGSKHRRSCLFCEYNRGQIIPTHLARNSSLAFCSATVRSQREKIIVRVSRSVKFTLPQVEWPLLLGTWILTHLNLMLWSIKFSCGFLNIIEGSLLPWSVLPLTKPMLGYRSEKCSNEEFIHLLI